MFVLRGVLFQPLHVLASLSTYSLREFEENVDFYNLTAIAQKHL